MRTDLPAPLKVVLGVIDILEDLGVIMTGGEDIDRDYLRGWADRLDLADALERALREADGI